MAKGKVVYVSSQSGLIDSEGYEFQFLNEEILSGVELQVNDKVSFNIDGDMAVRVKFLKAGEFDQETEEL
jgi:hypothetical protein